MRRSSLWLTVLLLGAVPLTAAAVDYGPNAPLLAAETNAPQLPGSQANAASHGEMPRPDADDDGSDAAQAATPQRMMPSASSPRALPPAHASGTAARNKPHGSASGAAPAQSTASWQSLLPGSIQ